MIERKAFLRITKAMIIGLRNGLTDPTERIKQNIIEELASVLGVERCVIFKVTREMVDSTKDAAKGASGSTSGDNVDFGNGTCDTMQPWKELSGGAVTHTGASVERVVDMVGAADGHQRAALPETEDMCEIIAGVPLSEYELTFRKKERLAIHPDIKAAVENGGMLLIRDPYNDSRTAYFKGMVEKKYVSEILYIPLSIDDDGQPAGVIVIDAIRGKKFSEDEILFCSEVAELVSLLLEQERVVLQYFRDEIINRIVPLGGFAKRLRDNLQTTIAYIDIIHEHAAEISTIVPKRLGRGL